MTNSPSEFSEEMQHFFQALADPNPADTSWIKTSKSDFNSAERLKVYTYAYHQRLLEAVITDYPGTAFFLTPEIFESYAQQFVTETPSRHWDLNLYSPAFAAWLKAKAIATTETPDPEGKEPEGKKTKEIKKMKEAASIAAIEAAIVSAYWHSDAVGLSPDFFSQISEEQLMNGRFIRKSQAHLLQLDYAAEDFIQAFRQEAPQPLSPTPQAVLVCKYQEMVKRIIVTDTEVYFLQALAAGKTLNQSVEHWLKAHPNAEATLLEQLPLYFQRWFTLGIFSDFSH